MRIEIEQWGSDLLNKSTKVVVGLYSEVEIGMEEKKTYSIIIDGTYDNITEEMKSKVTKKVKSVLI
jgi:hypothetical protein